MIIMWRGPCTSILGDTEKVRFCHVKARFERLYSTPRSPPHHPTLSHRFSVEHFLQTDALLAAHSRIQMTLDFKGRRRRSKSNEGPDNVITSPEDIRGEWSRHM